MRHPAALDRHCDHAAFLLMESLLQPAPVTSTEATITIRQSVSCHAHMSDPGRTCSLPACDHFRSFGNVSPSSFRLHCHCEAFSPRFVACPQLPSPRTSLRRKHLAYCLNETSFRAGELDSIISPPEPGVPLSSSGVASRI